LFIYLKWVFHKVERRIHINKEKSKDARSQSIHNFICVQTSYMFWLYVAIIRLNM